MSATAVKDITSNLSGRQKLHQNKMRYFSETLDKTGISLRSDAEPHVLTQEQPLVIRDLEKVISKDAEDENVASFIDGLAIHLKKNFRKALQSTNVRKSNLGDDTYHASIEQDSFLHILLHVTPLQKAVIDIILEEISEQVENSEGNEFLPLLLNVMKRLPIVRDPKTLTVKLLDILEISTFASQLEILNAIPLIIPESQYDVTAKQLSVLLEENRELTAAIINCFNLLRLSNEIRADIQDRLLGRLVGSVSVYPVLFEFLTSDCRQSNLPVILVKCRDALDDILSEGTAGNESQKLIIINKLHSSVSASKNLFESFVNVLTSITEYKPVDLLLMFILHNTGRGKQRIEGLFKKLVKSNAFKLTHVESLFQKYLSAQVISDYLGSIVEIASALLNSYSAVRDNGKESPATEFAGAIYKLTFKSVDRIQRQDVLHHLLLFAGSTDLKNITQVLNVLLDLKDSMLHQHTRQLMNLLEKLNVYDLNNVKQIFELLSSLICTDSHDGLKDELHMRIRKLLSSSEISLKRRGVIAAVVMAKCIATIIPETDDKSLEESLDDSITINDLRGKAQDAARLLELAGASCVYSVELTGLYYDQVANIASESLDKYFMKWLFDSITRDIQDKYVVDSVPEPINNVPFEQRYALNSLDEVSADIYVNIGGLSMKPTQQNSIAILASLFRLLRMLHFKQYNGDLSTIDALLGCGVILPNTGDLESYDYDQTKQVCDALFHCANWFRETISAFAKQKPRPIRRKVLARLEQLIEVEALLSKAITLDYKPPSSYFYNSQKIVNPETHRPKKRIKLTTNDEKTSAKTPKKTTSQTVRTIEFRELDTDVVILLKYPLKFSDVEIQATQQPTLSVAAFNFLIKDLSEKFRSLTKSKNASMSNLSGIASESLLLDCVRLLPNIYNKFQLLTARITNLVKEADHIYDHVTLYTEDAHDLKTTFSTVLECLSLIFAWNGFQNHKNVNLLRDYLKAVRPENSSTLHSANQLSREFVFKLAELTDECLYLQPAVHLIRIMQTLYGINISNIEVKKKITTTAAKFLSRPWYNLKGSPDTGKDMFTNIDILTQAYLDGASVKTLCGLVGTLQNQAGALKTKEDRLAMLQSIDRASFHILYRNLCIYLMDRLKIEVTSLTNAEHLTLWRTVSITLQGLMAVLKIHETRSNLIHFLKKSIGILKIFLSHGIPILGITLKSKTEQVVEILKTLQTTTRYLHYLCCHSKTTKDTALVAHIPKFRLTVETFIFRVKAALIENDCSAAFWLGNLRNKTLAGEPVPTQSSVASDETNEGDEELPPDDESEEDDSAQLSSNEGTASEIFD